MGCVPRWRDSVGSRRGHGLARRADRWRRPDCTCPGATTSARCPRAHARTPHHEREVVPGISVIATANRLDHDDGVDLVRFGRGIRALRHRRRWRQLDLATRCGREPVDGRPDRGRQQWRQSRPASSKRSRTRSALAPTSASTGTARRSIGCSTRPTRRSSRSSSRWHPSLPAGKSRSRSPSGSAANAARSTSLPGIAATRIVLVVEVKSVVPDIQAMLAALDRKVRLARRSPESAAGRRSPSRSCSSSARAERRDAASRRTQQTFDRRFRSARSRYAGGSTDPGRVGRRFAGCCSCQLLME